MRLIVDMDEVLCDFLGLIISIYNERYDANVTRNDIQDYAMSAYPELHEIYKEPNVFRSLQPLPGGRTCIGMLQAEGHEVVIASNNGCCGRIADEKYDWIRRNIPYFDLNNVVFGARKDILSGDLIFDDNPEYLLGFNGISVAMDRPYNRHLHYPDVHYRVQNWVEFIKLVRYISH